MGAGVQKLYVGSCQQVAVPARPLFQERAAVARDCILAVIRAALEHAYWAPLCPADSS